MGACGIDPLLISLDLWEVELTTKTLAKKTMEMMVEDNAINDHGMDILGFSIGQ